MILNMIIYMKSMNKEIRRKNNNIKTLHVTSYILHKWKFITLFAQKAASSPIPNP